MVFILKLNDVNFSFDGYNNYRVRCGLTPTRNNSLKKAILYINEKFSNCEIMSQDKIDEILINIHISDKSYNVFWGVFRGYLKYLNILGIESYIPDSTYSRKSVKYVPYVLSYDELNTFFRYIDNPIKFDYMKNSEYILPLFFRTMYCCGMRPQEVCQLKIDDINLETGEIYIRKTKSYKDRHIIMNQELLNMFRLYFNRVGFLNKQFVFEENGKIIQLYRFRKVLKISLKDLGIETSIRQYDFRHTFITNTIIEWLENDYDIYNLLPYLAQFVGHNEFNSTYYYLHLIPEALLDSKNIDWSRFENIYPLEGENNEI